MNQAMGMSDMDDSQKPEFKMDGLDWAQYTHDPSCAIIALSIPKHLRLQDAANSTLDEIREIWKGKDRLKILLFVYIVGHKNEDGGYDDEMMAYVENFMIDCLFEDNYIWQAAVVTESNEKQWHVWKLGPTENAFSQRIPDDVMVKQIGNLFSIYSSGNVECCDRVRKLELAHLQCN